MKLLMLIVILGTFSLPIIAEANIRYMVTDLGTLGCNNNWSYATSINDYGQIVGVVSFEVNLHSYNWRAFLWDGTMQDIGGLGGSDTMAWAINNKGQVVGESSTASDPYSHAFLYNGTMIDLAAFDGYNTTAYGINSNGVVVGSISGYSAFLYDGMIHDLGTHFDTVAINDHGWAVGRAGLFCNGYWHDLGTLYDWETCPTAINNRGHIAGYVSDPNSGGIGGLETNHAFLYDGAMLHDLGLMPDGVTSCATSINDNGLVVGWGFTYRENYGDSLGTHAFMYDGTNNLDLNDLIDPASGWVLREASDINNRGQIVGSGRNALGQSRAFLLTPVPEPSAVLSLATAIVVFTSLLYVQKKWKLIN